MANNFNLGARKMSVAGAYAANLAARQKKISFATAANLSVAWNLFTEFAADQNAKKMEFVTPDLVLSYGHELVIDVENQDITPGTAQGYISAVNSIMKIATKGQWKSVSPTKDCGIPERSFARTTPPFAIDRELFSDALEKIKTEISEERGVAIIMLCRELGLRSKEASLLNAKATLEEAQHHGFITIIDGTKGGRSRTLSITNPYQITALIDAAAVQNTNKSMIPPEQTWKFWRENDLRKIREAVQKMMAGDGLHDLRASYACERYQSLTGFLAPVCTSARPERSIDHAARLQISEELGHGRVAVTNAYLGGQRK
jgi:hypothetical protein